MSESDDQLDAHQIIIATALRFDGYKYIEDTGYEPSEQIEKRMHDEPTQWDDLQRMVVFFYLQRALCKWNLVYEEGHGKYWRIFREMFFEVIKLEVPPEYYYEQRYTTWQDRYAHRLDEAIECVRKEHESIEYDDNAPPNFKGV